MCIALLTTAHPAYALIVIDNRDEFILRPTSRPHWWTAGGTAEGAGEAAAAAAAAAAKPQEILSSRDLQRPEHGTWLGVTRAGHLAVLTNFREDALDDAAHPVHGTHSRGGMVTAWLTAAAAQPTAAFVAGLLAGGAVRGVGGFSLICGKLRRRCFDAHEKEQAGEEGGGLAVVSNRADELAQVPWIAGGRGAVYGLSNARYDEPEVWPKVRDGKAALLAVVEAAVAADKAARQKAKPTPAADAEDALRAALFAVLDRDTLPRHPDLSFDDQIPLLKTSIFIPPVGDAAHATAMAAAREGGPRTAPASAEAVAASERARTEAESPDHHPANGFMTGLYGTQRQTVLLVDWDGRVAFTERALWDANGNAIPRGEGDVHVEFTIDGWDE